MCFNFPIFSARVYTETDRTTSSLFLKDIQESDSGYYSCKSGDEKAIILLSVIGEQTKQLIVKPKVLIKVIHLKISTLLNQ